MKLLTKTELSCWYPLFLFTVNLSRFVYSNFRGLNNFIFVDPYFCACPLLNWVLMWFGKYSLNSSLRCLKLAINAMEISIPQVLHNSQYFNLKCVLNYLWISFIHIHRFNENSVYRLSSSNRLWMSRGGYWR